MKRKNYSTMDGRKFDKTLVRRLCPLADNLRHLLTRFGLRPYRVSILQTRWTAGHRGAGQEVVISAVEMLPTPKLTGIGELNPSIESPGLFEIGSVELSRISAVFTEEMLRGFDRDGTPPAEDVEVFYEIEFRDVNNVAVPRRFTLSSTPVYKGFGWTVSLTRAAGDRTRQSKELLS